MGGGREGWEDWEVAAWEERGVGEGEAGGERGGERAGAEWKVEALAEGWAGVGRVEGEALGMVRKLSGSCRWSRCRRRRSPCCR